MGMLGPTLGVRRELSLMQGQHSTATDTLAAPRRDWLGRRTKNTVSSLSSRVGPCSVCSGSLASHWA